MTCILNFGRVLGGPSVIDPMEPNKLVPRAIVEPSHPAMEKPGGALYEDDRFLKNPGILTPQQLEICPRRLRFVDPITEDTLPDIDHWRCGLILSDKAQRIYASLAKSEPQFIELDHSKLPEFAAAKKYSYLKVPVELDAVVAEQSEPESGPMSRKYKYIKYQNFRVTVRQKDVKGHLLWWNQSRVASVTFFISDDLMDGWRDGGVGPISYLRCNEI